MIPRLVTGWRPAIFLEHVPTLLPLTMCCTMEGYPAHELLQYCQEMEKLPGVVDCTVFHGFPYADIDIVGTSVYVATEDSPELAGDVAKRVGTWIWQNRSRFQLDVLGATSAVEAAVAGSQGPVDKPVVLNETADNTGCGAPGDSTHLLRAMIAAKLPPGSACFSTIYDPEVAAQAHAAGVGATIEIELGGKLDPAMHGTPIVSTATVRTLTDGEFKLVGPMNTNGIVRLGLSARLEVSGVDVVVASERVQTLDIGSFALHGIDVTTYKLVGLKSSTHFRAGMAEYASQIITADEPGLASGRLEVFESLREHAPEVAHWPIVADAEYANELVASAAEELARL